MVRVLHTGDWHIGQTLRGYSREYEQAQVFDQLIGIVAERGIDVLIVAGDIFDSQNPSGEAQRLFYETIERLHRARPSMKTVIVAGSLLRRVAPEVYESDASLQNLNQF